MDKINFLIANNLPIPVSHCNNCHDRTIIQDINNADGEIKMNIQTRYTKTADWKPVDEKFVEYYFGTSDMGKVKDAFSGKKVVKKMNMYFRIVK